MQFSVKVVNHLESHYSMLIHCFYYKATFIHTQQTKTKMTNKFDTYYCIYFILVRKKAVFSPPPPFVTHSFLIYQSSQTPHFYFIA